MVPGSPASPAAGMTSEREGSPPILSAVTPDEHREIRGLLASRAAAKHADARPRPACHPGFGKAEDRKPVTPNLSLRPPARSVSAAPGLESRGPMRRAPEQHHHRSAAPVPARFPCRPKRKKAARRRPFRTLSVDPLSDAGRSAGSRAARRRCRAGAGDRSSGTDPRPSPSTGRSSRRSARGRTAR